MRLPDLDRERSEKHITFAEFLRSYNTDLPVGFPQASVSLLKEFRKNNEALFKDGGAWSLDRHRKKVMDWLTIRKHDE